MPERARARTRRRRATTAPRAATLPPASGRAMIAPAASASGDERRDGEQEARRAAR